MSNYKKLTKHPETKQFELATWYDNYFGEHNYGVIFDSHPNVVFDPRDEELEVLQGSIVGQSINELESLPPDVHDRAINTMKYQLRESLDREPTMNGEEYLSVDDINLIK